MQGVQRITQQALVWKGCSSEKRISWQLFLLDGGDDALRGSGGLNHCSTTLSGPATTDSLHSWGNLLHSWYLNMLLFMILVFSRTCRNKSHQGLCLLTLFLQKWTSWYLNVSLFTILVIQLLQQMQSTSQNHENTHLSPSTLDCIVNYLTVDCICRRITILVLSRTLEQKSSRSLSTHFIPAEICFMIPQHVVVYDSRVFFWYGGTKVVKVFDNPVHFRRSCLLDFL